MTYPSEVMADSPLAFWEFDEAAAPTAADSAGGVAWAFGAGAVGNQTAVVPDGGKSIHGSGTAPIATISAVPTAINGANVTLEAWVHLPGGNVKGSFVKVGSSANGWGMGIGGTQWDNVGQKLILLSEAVAWHPTTYTFPGAGDYHVMVVRGAAGAVTAYVNNAAVWTGTLTSPITASGQMGVGGYTEPNGFKLSSTINVDNAAAYPSALSSARVSAHYNSGSGSSTAVAADSPTWWLKLDETVTSVAPASLDASGNARHLSYSATMPLIAQPSLLGDGSGRSITINSTEHYLTIASAAWMDTTGGLTVEARIKPTAAILANGGFIASRWASAGGNSWLFGVTSTGKLTASIVTGGTQRNITGTTTLTADTIYTVSLRWTSGGNVELFLNGASDATGVSAPGALATPAVPIEVGRAALAGGVGITWNGGIDELSITGSALSGTRLTARHAAAIDTGGTTGTVAGTLPALTGSITGTVTAITTGAVAGTLPSLTGTVTGGAIVVGASDGTLPSLTGSVTGTVEGPTTGTVAGTLPSLTGSVAGNVTAPVSGTVAGTLPALIGLATDNTVGVEVPIGITIEVGALTLLNLVTLPGVEVAVGLGVEVGESQAVIALPGVSIEVGLSLIARPVDVRTPDPRRQGPQWRYVITDLANEPIGELTDIQHDPVEDGVGEPATMQFVIPTDSPQHALFRPIVHKCQVWDGDILRLFGPILPGVAGEDGTTTYKVHDPSWFIRDGRRVITRTPQLNLLRNGDFKDGLAWWTRGYDPDSKPKAAPNVRVVSEDFVDDTDGLDPIKAAEITGVESVTEAELSSNAVFWPNLATFRPGGKASIEAVANAMPTTAGLKVSIVGHTANDGTGSGLNLSKRRADAAAAIIHAKRPGAVITTKGVGYYDPKPGFPIGSQEQRRVVIQYDQTITGESKQWMKQRVEVTQPKSARYPLVLTLAALLKVADDWSVPDANMVSLKMLARRKEGATPPKSFADALAAAQADYAAALAELATVKADTHSTADELKTARDAVATAKAKLTEAKQNANAAPWDEQLGVGSSSISDTDPIDRWIPQTTQVTIPADGRAYLVDVYLYAPAALARYTAVRLVPDEMLYYWGVDQALIFKGVVEHIQKPEFGYANLGIATRTPLTGVKRDRGPEWRFSNLTPADTALDGLMGINRGIEWDTVTTPTKTTATTFYPRQGKTVDYVLALGSNLVNATPANTRDVGSAVIAQAQGLGSYRAEAYANDKRAFGGTLIQRVITAEQDTPLNELGEAAKAELFWAKSSTPAYWVDVDPEAMADVLANTAKGDTVRLILDGPYDVDQLARIVRRQIHPDSLRLMLAFEEV